MAQTNLNIRIDENLKEQFDKLCNELGFNMSTAVNIFAKTMVRQQALPFVVSLDTDTPNQETMEAIHDAIHGKNLSKSFHSVAELMEDLNND